MSHAPSSHAALGHVVPLGVLAAVFATLLALTALTVTAAYIDLGKLNLYVALGIAGLKATLVVLYFMHLRYDRPFNLAVFLSCLAFVVLFIGVVLTDTRAYAPSKAVGQAQGVKDIHTPLGTPRR